MKKFGLPLESYRRVSESFRSSEVSGDIRNRFYVKNYVCIGLGRIPETSRPTSGTIFGLEPLQFLLIDLEFLLKTSNTAGNGSFKGDAGPKMLCRTS